ncbi:MAG: glutathione S-transferase N-terminal domain-containing protein [Pseudomonadota bacterium]
MLEFFYTPDTCALASHIALRDAGADFQLRRIDFAAEEQKSEAFLKVNPKARVPALVTPRGVLTETPAILAFVAQSWPEAKLAPLDDPFAFAAMQSFNNYLCSTLHVAHAHSMRGSRWADEPEAIEAMRRKVPQSVAAAYDYVEEALVGPFVMGDAYSVADPYLFTIASWMESDSVDPARFPKTAAHRDMMRTRSTVADALRIEAGG